MADFVHQHDIKQVIGDGPSASPYARALARAYKRRHGGELKVVNLGTVGEHLQVFALHPEATENADQFLHHLRPLCGVQ